MAPDLRIRPPRRWSDSIDGLAWLPRLIDKARAMQAGTLGDYLFGHSPYDAAFLGRLGLTHAEFASIVTADPSDEGVRVALAARDPVAYERARRWSQRLATRHKTFMAVLDLDDGYAQGPLARALKLPTNACAFVVVRILRAVRAARE